MVTPKIPGAKRGRPKTTGRQPLLRVTLSPAALRWLHDSILHRQAPIGVEPDIGRLRRAVAKLVG